MCPASRRMAGRHLAARGCRNSGAFALRAISRMVSVSTQIAANAGITTRAVMILLKQILVATDFSDTSAAALDYGRALARTFGASLHLLHVMENPFLRPTAADPHAIASATSRRLAGRLTDDDRGALHATVVLETS